MSEGELFHTEHFKKLEHRVKILEERMDNMAGQVEQAETDLNTLKSDLSTKFGEIDTEFATIEREKSEGKEPDLTKLKGLVADVDGAVKSFTPTAPAPAPEGGTGGPQPGQPAPGGAPAGS